MAHQEGHTLTPDEQTAIDDFVNNRTPPPEAPPGRRRGGARIFPQISPSDAALAENLQQSELGQERLGFTTRRRMSGAQGQTTATLQSGGDPIEALAALHKRYPEGELRIATGMADSLFSLEATARPVLMWRPNATEGWSRVDPKTGVTFKGGEVVNDVIEFFGDDLGAFLGEAGLLALQGPAGVAKGVGRLGIRSVNAMSQLLKIGGAAVVGDLAQEALQTAEGIQSETQGERLEGAAGQGIIAFAGGAAADVILRRGANLITGRGVVGLEQGMDSVMATARANGLKDLPTSVVANNGLVRRLGAQAAVLSAALKDRLAEIRGGAAMVWERLRVTSAQEARGVTYADLIRIHNQEEAALRIHLNKKVGWTSIDSTDAGQAIADGVAIWDITNGALVDMAYGRARSFEVPAFDIRQLTQGMPAIRAMIDDIVDPNERAIANNMVKGLDDMFGRTQGPRVPGNQPGFGGGAFDPAAGQMPEPTLVLRDRVLPGEAGGPGVTVNPTQQLVNAARTANQNSFPAPGQQPGNLQRLATKIRNEVEAVLDNPANSSPEFTAAWGEARALSRSVRNQQDDIFWRQVVASDKPGGPDINTITAQLSNMTDPGNIRRWEIVERSMSPERVNRVKDSIMSNMMNRPDTLSAALAGADQNVMDRILTKAEQVAVKAYAEGYDKLAQLGIKKAATRANTMAGVVGDLVASGDRTSVSQMKQIMNQNGGRDSDIGRYLRAGLIDWFIQQTVDPGQVTKAGVPLISAAKFSQTFARLQTSGALDILTKADREMFSGLGRLQEALNAAIDAGSSIAGASDVKGIKRLSGSAIRGFVEAVGLGRFLIAAAPWLTGRGKAKFTATNVTTGLGAAYATVVGDEERWGAVATDIIRLFGRVPQGLGNFAVGKAREMLNQTGPSPTDVVN
jgi:hypothetical protein